MIFEPALSTELKEFNRPAAVAFSISFWEFLVLLLGITIWAFSTPVVY